MTNIADLALAAAADEKRIAELEQQAALTRAHTTARNQIVFKGEKIGVDVDIDAIEHHGGASTYRLKVDEDATLVISSRAGDLVAKAKVKPAEQLYWNLPPGQEGTPMGGTYGCYGLGQYSALHDIDSLADLGRAITLVREARAKWRRVHGQEDA